MRGFDPFHPGKAGANIQEGGSDISIVGCIYGTNDRSHSVFVQRGIPGAGEDVRAFR